MFSSEIYIHGINRLGIFYLAYDADPFFSQSLRMNLIYVTDPCHHAFVFIERAQLYWNFVFEDFYKYL